MSLRDISLSVVLGKIKAANVNLIKIEKVYVVLGYIGSWYTKNAKDRVEIFVLDPYKNDDSRKLECKAADIVEKLKFGDTIKMENVIYRNEKFLITKLSKVKVLKFDKVKTCLLKYCNRQTTNSTHNTLRQ